MFIYEQEVITISQYIVGIEFIPKETSQNNKIKIILPSDEDEKDERLYLMRVHDI